MSQTLQRAQRMRSHLCCSAHMQVQFDGADAAETTAGAQPPVLFCTDDGVIGRTVAAEQSHRGTASAEPNTRLTAACRPPGP